MWEAAARQTGASRSVTAAAGGEPGGRAAVRPAPRTAVFIAEPRSGLHCSAGLLCICTAGLPWPALGSTALQPPHSACPLTDSRRLNTITVQTVGQPRPCRKFYQFCSVELFTQFSEATASIDPQYFNNQPTLKFSHQILNSSL